MASCDGLISKFNNDHTFYEMLDHITAFSVSKYHSRLLKIVHCQQIYGIKYLHVYKFLL